LPTLKKSGFNAKQLTQMKHSLKRNSFLSLGLLAAVLAAEMMSAPRAQSFSLLGPYTDWMVESNGYRWAGDIGGPMDLDEEYRWNVPVVTYGFDQSFLDYFGTNGVKAVEEAIHIVNALPRASRLELTNYPLYSKSMNYMASAKGLYDLKSETLALLLEQMGLGTPSQNAFALRRWDRAYFSSYLDEFSWPEGTIPYYVIQRNFDPVSYLPSREVNGVMYTAYASQYSWAMGASNYVFVADAMEVPFDSLAFQYPAVADANGRLAGWLNAGDFFTSLTRDDVGGLKYLLRKENVNFERLPSGTHSNHPLGAWRQGVEKILLVRQPYLKRHGRFLPFISRFTSRYMKNNVVKCQSVVRVVNHPDFLFRAADTGQDRWFTSLTVRTSTTNWVNNAGLNGDAMAAGPGIIQPSIQIAFHKWGSIAWTSDYFEPWITEQGWGSFDSSTNPPVIYPSGLRNTNELTVRLFFRSGNFFVESQTWHLAVPVSNRAVLQISTNQTDWTSLYSITNSGSVMEWIHDGSTEPQKFFRVVPSVLIP
jgi:hypothetical protein